jgi:L-histidine N-alpha-methyltransferase
MKTLIQERPPLRRPGRVQIDVCRSEAESRRARAAMVRRGLSSTPKWLSPELFYDPLGSRLFDRITRLPEYYLTRAERSILRARGRRLIDEVRPQDIVELGSGSADKISELLEVADAPLRPLRYVAVDIDETSVAAAARRLRRSHPAMVVHGVVGDFQRHLWRVPEAIGRRIVMFLGSTIGNLHPPERRRLLEHMRLLLGPGDRLLLGLDLVKDRATLEAAYNDAAGVTARFNRNMLSVVNRELDGDFPVADYRHLAWYNEAAGRVEMHLLAGRSHVARLGALDLDVEVAQGEGIWTESCYKFSRSSAAAMLAEADLALLDWLLDDHERFALAVVGPAERP